MPLGGSLPVESHEGLAPVAVTSEWEAAHLVADPLPRTIARVALPAVASSLLMTLFFSVDTFWIGTHVGATGLAAASTAVFWIWLLVSIAEMVSVGLTAVASRRHGEGRGAEAARHAGDALVLALVLGTICGIAGLALLPHLFAVMHTPPEVTALGLRYLGTYFLGAPLIFGFFAVDAAFRAAGDTRTSFLLLSASVAVTLVLDPVLIVGWGPVPALGVSGAAIATICTRAVAFGLGLLIVGRRGVLKVGRPDWRTLATIARIGLPTAVTGVVFSLIYVLVTRTATQFGTPALAALGIGHRVESWLFMIGVGFGAATAAIVGQNLGAGRTDRAERAGWISVGFCTLFGVAACVVELLVPERFASIFPRSRGHRRGGAVPAHRRHLPARHLRRDRARGRARRCRVHDGAHADVHGDHGESHPGRSLGGGPLRHVGPVVDHLPHGPRARRRHDGHLALGALEG